MSAKSNSQITSMNDYRARKIKAKMKKANRRSDDEVVLLWDQPKELLDQISDMTGKVADGVRNIMEVTENFGITEVKAHLNKIGLEGISLTADIRKAKQDLDGKSGNVGPQEYPLYYKSMHGAANEIFTKASLLLTELASLEELVRDKLVELKENAEK